MAKESGHLPTERRTWVSGTTTKWRTWRSAKPDYRYAACGHGTPNVKGVETDNNGSGRYYGEWRDSDMTGNGVMCFNWTYEGQWQDGKGHGNGVITYTSGNNSGNKYEGQWQNGNMHGVGLYKSVAGANEARKYANTNDITNYELTNDQQAAMAAAKAANDAADAARDAMLEAKKTALEAMDEAKSLTDEELVASKNVQQEYYKQEGVPEPEELQIKDLVVKISPTGSVSDPDLDLVIHDNRGAPPRKRKPWPVAEKNQTQAKQKEKYQRNVLENITNKTIYF